MTRTLRWR